MHLFLSGTAVFCSTLVEREITSLIILCFLLSCNSSLFEAEQDYSTYDDDTGQKDADQISSFVSFYLTEDDQATNDPHY